MILDDRLKEGKGFGLLQGTISIFTCEE